MRVKYMIPLSLATTLFAAGCMLTESDRGAIVDRSPFPKQEACKWGFQDKTGNVVIHPSFDGVGDFHEGLAWVRSGSKYGFVNIAGTLVVDTLYDDVTDMVNGYAGVILNGKSGFIDATPRFTALLEGELVFSYQEMATVAFSEGLAVARNGTKFGYVNTRGVFQIPASYSDAHPFSEEVASVKNGNGFWGFIDKSGKSTIGPQFSDAGDFHLGLAAAKMGNKWGFLEKSGRMAIQPQWDSVSGFNEDLALVYRDGLAGFIDKSGHEVISPRYKHALSVSEGLAAVQGSDGRWSYVNKQGQPAFIRSFYIAWPFRGGYALEEDTTTGGDGKPRYVFGLINKTGINVGVPNNTFEACDPNDNGGSGTSAYEGAWGANYAILNSDKTDSIHLAVRWTFTSGTFIYELDLDFQGSFYPFIRRSGTWEPTATGAKLVPTACSKADSSVSKQVPATCPTEVIVSGLPNGDLWPVSVETFAYTLRYGYAPVPMTRPVSAQFSPLGDWSESSSFRDTETGATIKQDVAMRITASGYSMAIAETEGSASHVTLTETGSWSATSAEVDFVPSVCNEYDPSLGKLQSSTCEDPWKMEIDLPTSTLRTEVDSTLYIFNRT